MRRIFLIISAIAFITLGALGFYNPSLLWAFVFIIPLFILGLYNLAQPRHTISRNFPLLGYLRYFFEFISPEIQQYFIERSTDGRPFSRNHRALVYQRAKDVNDTHPFGTQLDLNEVNYEGLRHSIYASKPAEDAAYVTIGTSSCKQPYQASLLNVSAMSFGSISKNAVLALGNGARQGGFYVNTGEGGLSDYHLQGGNDVVWQIGTGYFGCRTPGGAFDADQFKEKAQYGQVRMIEVKLSQGAKPGHGGVLPATKNTPEIAKIRGLAPYTAVISPPSHHAFQDAEGLLAFIQQLRELSGGKPVGFKLCIGQTDEFTDICEAMNNTDILPDFISIDGAEGGTGAAPLEFSDSVGMPLEPALIFVKRTLKQYQLYPQIKIIASGKVITGASMLRMIALGADLCNSARAFMFSVGCIQALRCNNNSCPTGVATQDPSLVNGLDVADKQVRAYNFHHHTIKAAMELMGACGVSRPEEVTPEMFIRGDEMVDLENRYFPDSLV